MLSCVETYITSKETLVAQSCSPLCHPMDCSPPGSSVHGDSPGKSTGVGCHALLQGIFPNQVLNPGPPHCGWILYWLSHLLLPLLLLSRYQGSPITGSSAGKESAWNAGDHGSIPGSGRSLEEGSSYPLQYFCLENSMDRGAWKATVQGIAESDTSEWLTLVLLLKKHHNKSPFYFSFF